MTIKKRFLRGSVPGCAALAGLGLVISLVQTSVVSAAFAQQSSLKTEALNTLSAPAAAGDSALSPPPAPPELEDASKSVGAEPVMPDQPKPAAANGENPYGLKALWKNGDAIARSVLLIMAFMSVGSWIIIVMKFIEESRLFRAAKQAAAHFWGQKSVHEGVSYLSEDSPFRYIADSAIAAAEHHEGSMRDSIDLQDWISMSISRAVDTINSRLQGGLAFLGTVGSTSPFIGLFGTVWGIYHALTAIGIAGQASIDKVAGPVGESLIMTAIGLATAVPAVLGYNLLVRRNKACMERVRDFASDVLSVLIGGCTHDDALASVHASLKPAEGQEPPTTITSSSRV